MKILAVAACLALSGCGASPIVVAAGLGLAAGLTRPDNALLQFWLAEKGLKPVAASAPIAAAKLR